LHVESWRLKLRIVAEINPMQLIYIPSQGAHYNLDRLLKMQYESGKEEILEGEIIMLEGDRHFDDRKRTGKFRSSSQLKLTFSTEPPDVVELTGEEADKIYEEIIGIAGFAKA
jgi:hypothetical protein